MQPSAACRASRARPKLSLSVNEHLLWGRYAATTSLVTAGHSLVEAAAQMCEMSKFTVWAGQADEAAAADPTTPVDQPVDINTLSRHRRSKLFKSFMAEENVLSFEQGLQPFRPDNEVLVMLAIHTRLLAELRLPWPSSAISTVDIWLKPLFSLWLRETRVP